MAYDPNAAYEAPRRAYYPQQQQQAPAQGRQGYGHQEQYDGYGEQTQPYYEGDYDQGYGQGYGEPRSAPPDGPHGRRMPRPQYDGNHGGPAGYREPPRWHEVRGPPPGPRHHDPRYQQRPGREYQQGYDRQQGRPPPRQDLSRQHDSRGYSDPNDRDPRSQKHWFGDERPPLQQQRSGGPQVQQPRPSHDQGYDQPRSSMEQWKAQERERMHAETTSPHSKPWDSAFPVFHGTIPKAEKARIDQSDQNNDISNDYRRGDDPGRPSTSVGMSRPGPGGTARHGSSLSFDASTRTRHDSDQYASQGIQQRMDSGIGQAYHEQYSRNGAGPQVQPQQQSRGPPLQPIDTWQAQQQPVPTYMDHQPLSPGAVPPRPATAQASRSRYDQGPVPPQPQATHNTQQRNYPGQPGFQPPVRAMTRDEEIEAEMPDFDSAAPSQTSMVHKRTELVKRGANGAPNNISQPALGQRSGSDPQALPQQYSNNFGNDTVSASPLEYGQPQRAAFNAYEDDANSGYGQFGPYDAPGPADETQAPQQQRPVPFRPPFADEQPVRRSMDDVRQMPYRPGPPPQFDSQRNGPGRPSPRGQMGHSSQQQQRQPMERSNTGGLQRPPHFDQDRAGSAPPMPPFQQRSSGGGSGGGGGGTPVQGYQQPPSSAPPIQQGFELPQQTQQPRNDDALPRHPTPVRPGLMNQQQNLASRAPPVRNSNDTANTSRSRHGSQQDTGKDTPSQPVTKAELEQLRAAVDAQPNSNRQGMLLVKKLVEASTVLSQNSPQADPRMTARTKEKYQLEAYKRLKRLVVAGYPDAQFYLADAYGQGSLGLDADDKEAFNLYQAAAKACHPEAAYRTALCCEIGPDDGGGTRRDYAKAVQWYRRAAALGDTSGMYKLGIILLRGLLGQPRSISEAVGWLKRAAEKADKDHSHALFELAQLHDPSNTDAEVRQKVPADESYARDLFQRAAKYNHKAAQFRLGQAHEYGGLGLPLDHRASIAWYSKSAGQGDHQAELALSGWYLTGAEGILEHSDTEAYLWARKAASSEPPLAKAMYAMGYYSESGIGCPTSLDEAKRWYGRAASYKFPKAQERLEELRKNPPKSGGRGGGGGGNSGARPPPANGKLTRKDQKRDEAECVMM